EIKTGERLIKIYKYLEKGEQKVAMGYSHFNLSVFDSWAAPFILEASIGGKILPKKLYCNALRECGLFNATSPEPKIEVDKTIGIINLYFNSLPYSQDAFQKEFPNIKFEGDYKNGEQFYTLAKYLKMIPKTVTDSIKSIGVYSEAGYSSSGCAETFHRTRKIRILKRCLTVSTVYHEAAHARTFKLEEEKSLFSNNWKRIAEQKGEVYDKYTDAYDLWIQLPREGPRHGCVRPYGCTNTLEDIATFVEPFTPYDRQFITSIISPKGTYYDPLYLKKYTLAKNYGFISNENYAKITSIT
ncbi:hypothetical protein HY643_03755, partial [Candidatus Woesearchaeota archaeon]|nr:hypothetical protein [Candidatus Woesearchaeota archaeon]